MKKLSIIIICLICTGCAHISRDATSLSIEIGGMITSSRKIHTNLLDKFVKEKRGRVDDFLKNVYAPRTIQQMMKDEEFDNLICGRIESYDSALALKEFVDMVAMRVTEKRLELMLSIDEGEIRIRSRINNHYNDLQMANNALTANLKSYQKNKEFRNKILKKLKIDPEKLKFKKFNKLMEKINVKK